jgi:hypothetical protein
VVPIYKGLGESCRVCVCRWHRAGKSLPEANRWFQIASKHCLHPFPRDKFGDGYQFWCVFHGVFGDQSMVLKHIRLSVPTIRDMFQCRPYCTQRGDIVLYVLCSLVGSQPSAFPLSSKQFGSRGNRPAGGDVTVDAVDLFGFPFLIGKPLRMGRMVPGVLPSYETDSCSEEEFSDSELPHIVPTDAWIERCRWALVSHSVEASMRFGRPE